ncbi:MAG: transcriptional regulator with XRE-family HTH domain [Gammaproteobacteria bacterium]
MPHRYSIAEPDELSATNQFADLGDRLRSMRQAHGLTLDMLAQRTRYSKSYLSRIENGKKVPPLATLARIANAFGVQLGELLNSRSPQASAVVSAGAPFCEIVRADRREEIIRGASALGYDYLSLANATAHRHMQPFLFTFPAEIDKHFFFEHEGEEFMFILSGTVEWQVGHEKHMLESNDSVYFDARLPHRGRAIDGEAKAIVVLYAPDASQCK